jgi:uncharacterized tellurite resistance protein B-like protein
MSGGKFDFSESIRKSLLQSGTGDQEPEPENPLVPTKKAVLSTRAPIQDLEFALTVLLVELASSDENFDQDEYHTITMSLQRVFDTDRAKAKEYINRASVSLSQVRGTTSYARLLGENLSLDERRMITDIIDELISADGEQDPFEIYHKNRIRHILLPEDKKDTDEE